MRFLIDAQLPPRLCDWLSDKGHAAEHVADIGLVDAPDRIIADHAERHELILVSKDEDFLLIRLPDRFALLWLRIGNATNRSLTTWLDVRWNAVESALTAGNRLVEVR